MEEAVAEVWAEVLGLQSVGVTDNFFDLGGHSLSAMQVLSRLRDRLRVTIPPGRFMEAPTVSELCEGLSAPAPEGGSAGETIPRVSRAGRRVKLSGLTPPGPQD